ncbi:MAG: hypothetical protein QME05_05110 [Candidatus Margulisbacteria bacterium]|nr:hypothetical protein [Candidatus Margulisiibacteriota bacterium]
MKKSNYIEKEEFIGKAEAIYKKLMPRLGKKYKGDVMAIEPESKKYVIAKDELEAALKAKKHFPRKVFYFVRIGYPVVHKFRKYG